MPLIRCVTARDACHSSLPNDPTEPHNVNRELLVLSEVMDDVLQILEMEVDMDRHESRDGTVLVFVSEWVSAS